MKRVHQSTVTYENEARELVRSLEDAMYEINEAMSALMGFGEFEEWFNTLDNMLDEMEPEFDRLDTDAAEEDERELQAMNREYYSNLL